MTASSVMSSQVKPAAAMPRLQRLEVPAGRSSRCRAAPSRSCAPTSSGTRSGRCRPPGRAAARNSRSAPGPLRQPQDVVFLPALPAQRALLHVRQPLEVEVAAGDHRDHASARRRRGRPARRSPARRRARAPRPRRSASRSWWRRCGPPARASTSLAAKRRSTAKFASPMRATAAPSTKLSTSGSVTRLARLERPPEARAALGLDEAHRRRAGPARRRPCTMPEARPPPPPGSTRRSGAGSSARISSATVAWPSITSASSKGGRNSAPVCAVKAWAARSVASK